MTAAPQALRSVADLDRVVADPLRFKARLRIGEDVYVLRRLTKEAWRWWDAAGVAGTGVVVAKSSVVASTLFAPSGTMGLLASIGLIAPVTPVGWVVAAAVLAGGGYYGVTRWLASRPDDAVDVIPRFINTPIDLLGASLLDVAGGLAMGVAAADGQVAAAEREVILSYFVGDWGYDRDYVVTALALLESEVTTVDMGAAARRIVEFLAANRDCNAPAMRTELLAFLREVSTADGRLDDAEHAALREVEEAFNAADRWMPFVPIEQVREAAAAAGTSAGEAVEAVRKRIGRLWSKQAK